MNTEWKKIRVGDVVTFQNGYAFKSKSFTTNGNYKLIRIKELDWVNDNINTKMFIKNLIEVNKC